MGSIKEKAGGFLFVAFVGVGALGIVESWAEAAELRAHGVRATARVEAVVRSGRLHEELLALPGDQEVTIDVGFLGPMAVVGDRMKVTYDPADPTVMDKGWGVNYVRRVLLTLLETAGILVAIRYLYSVITHRPLVPDRLGAWADRGFRRSRALPPPAPPRFVPGTVRKRKTGRRRR